MAFGKSMGVLIIVALVVLVFFLIVRKEIIGSIKSKDTSTAQAYVTYGICYLIFVGFIWCFINLFALGIKLIVG